MTYEEINESNRYPTPNDDNEILDLKIQYYIDHHYCISNVRMLDRISQRYKDLEKKYKESIQMLNSQIFKDFSKSCNSTAIANMANDIKVRLTNDIRSKVHKESLKRSLQGQTESIKKALEKQFSKKQNDN